MKALRILNSLDNQVTDKEFSRREAFSKGINLGIKGLFAAVPLAMLLKPTKTYAGTTSAVDVLNFALTLEYLEAKFYQMGLSAGIVPSSDTAVITQIGKHETSHVATLKAAISSAGGTPVAEPSFDFTAGGSFPDVFTNYATFLTLANAFEDTGVRAYKGQAPNLLGTDLLTAALDIHSVEARHASEIRRLRGQKGWITGNMTTGVPATIYAGEDNVTQGGVDVTTVTTVTAAYIMEAFDEPLTMAQVLAIAKPFIKM
ncbi:MAG TPA: ferritin-like domain-containing protein [Puia sp.]